MMIKDKDRLSERITRPVMPNDEPSNYIVTQAIADYLAAIAELDGIIYASAQAGGATRNVVLFHHAELSALAGPSDERGEL